jgi:putative phage-type endonuclease
MEQCKDNEGQFMEAHLIQGSEAWLEFRKTMITASDSSKIMGCSPYGTEYGLWLEKIGISEPKKISYAMQYGSDMEPVIRKWYEDKEKNWFPPEVVISEETPWLMASLDGISADRKTIVEIKTCGKKVFEDVKLGNIPKHYICQGMHQMACVPEADRVHFIFFNQGEYEEIDLNRDDGFISKMVEQERIFYENYFLTKLPPPTSEKDVMNMSDDAEWIHLAMSAKTFYEEYKIEQARFKKFKEKWDSYKKQFIELSDDGSCQGGGVRLTKSWRSGGIDINKLEKDGIDSSKYLKSGSPITKLTILKE